MPTFAEVTFVSLLEEMTNLERLSYFPSPAYTCKQFSSYDRRSTDKTILTDDNWFANSDRGQHIRVEERNGQQEWVMMDADGPGTIVRIWSANPDHAGIIRVYLDDAPDPIIEMPLIELLSGKTWPFLYPIAHWAASGWNSYLPIPYQKHCKVTASSPNFYYHINYRTYSTDTVVETYSEQVAQRAETQIRTVAERLSRPDTLELPPEKNAKQTTYSITLKPETQFLRSFTGPAAIYGIEMRVNGENLEKALRACAIELRFDDARIAQVWTPLGDFFGTAPGINGFSALPCGARNDGTLYAHWVMPFSRKATMKIKNLSDENVQIEARLIMGKYDWNSRSLYFHASWRNEYPIPTLPRQDWTFLQASGKGVFVGTMLHVSNPVRQWWGEGDEKIYVDGEDFPSHFGTGSEDYFGYAWCSPLLFTHAYHAQPRCDGPGNYGQTCVSRFHILDNIPFNKEFQFDMEVWHSKECEVAMAATTYWYGNKAASHTNKPINKKDLFIVELPSKYAKKVENALEGESLCIRAITGGKTFVQTSEEFEWSSGKQLWWFEAKPGDSLTLEFPVQQAGRYEVLVALTKAPDYGIVQLRINEEEFSDPVDCFHEKVISAEPVSLGEHELLSGMNTMTVEIVGTNEKASPKYMFGIDYSLLKPITP